MNTVKALLSTAAIAATAAVSSAHAFLGSWDLLSTTVPASLCTPVDSASAAKVRLSNGAWVFQGNHTGAVQFYCPLNLNGHSISDSMLAAMGADDVDGGSPAPPSIQLGNSVNFYRIYYRDTDGGLENDGGRGPGGVIPTGEFTSVKAAQKSGVLEGFNNELDIVDEGAPVAPGEAASVKTMLMYRDQDGRVAVSDSYWTSDWTLESETVNTTAEHGLQNSHAMEIDALYAFEVELYRANADENPAFSGIDFLLPNQG